MKALEQKAAESRARADALAKQTAALQKDVEAQLYSFGLKLW